MTKTLLTCLLSGALLSLALSQPGRADTLKAVAGKANTYVILVGISDYADKKIKPRPNAEKDVAALYKLFTDKKYLGVDPKNVKLLEGNPQEGAEKATKANFLKALKWVAEEAKPDDLVLVAIVGEGGPLGDSGDRRCYFMSDSTFAGRDKDAVASEEIEDALKKLKSKHMTAFLDVNFKGFEADKAIAEPTLGKAPYKEFLGDDGSDDHLSKPGRVAFLATNGLNPSLDLKDHGVFTTVLLEGLGGKADTEGYEPDGLVTVDELVKYVNKRLPTLARTEGKTEKEKEQDHFIVAGPSSHYVLTKNPKAADKAAERLAKFEELVRDKKLTDAKRIEEGRDYLTRMPRLKKRQEVRKVYQEFVDGKVTEKGLEEKRDAIVASMKLKQSEAAQFALKVLEVIELMQEKYVKAVNPGKLAGSAITELYSYVEEKIPDEIAAKLKDVQTLRTKQLHELLAEARSALGNREDLADLKDLTVALTRMLHKLDAHTTYIDPESLRQFKQDISGNFTGIGIQIRKDAASDELLVVTPIKGSPAYKKGIQAGDIITEVVRDVDSEGKPLPKTERTPTKGMTTNAAVKIILGQPDTKVGIMVRREGVKEPFLVEINRGRVEVESILGYKRKDNADWEYMIDPQSKIGYIRMSSFARTTYRDLEAAVDELKKQGVKGLVFDLRFNPGGLLDSAIKVTDLFVDDGLIVSIRPRGGPQREAKFNGRSPGSLLDFPMVCLVNGYSASGSEIVSAALQDHNRAMIFGERSYGKGSVQNIEDFEVTDPKTGKPLKAEIKYTTATFWRPNGKNLNKSSTAGKDDDVWGVTPDKVIKLTAKERRDLAEHQRNSETIEPKGKSKLKKFEDRQLDAALEYLRGQIKLAGRAAK
jgi:carboxyl-terminal processing protease